MLVILGVFVFWLALHGRLNTYAGFVTAASSSSPSSSAAPGTPVMTPNGQPGVVTHQAGPVTIVNTQPGVSTSRAILNNVMHSLGLGN